MVEFIIKRVRVEDLAETIDLFIQQVYPGDPARAHEHFSGHAERLADTFLAWVNGRLAGYLTLRWESNNPLFRERNIPLIHHLGVFPQYQRRGIASRLMDEAERLIATRATQAGITVGLFGAYGPAQGSMDGADMCRMDAVPVRDCARSSRKRWSPSITTSSSG